MYGMLFLSDLNHTYIFGQILVKSPNIHFQQNHVLEAQLFHADRQMDIQTDIHDTGNGCFPKLREHA